MAGAELPIVHKRNKDYPVAIYVGKSGATDALGITDKGLLERDACRMVSGPDYLVLLGHDSDYEISEARLRAISKSPSKKRGFKEGKNRASGIRPKGDKGGSLQAVYGFLRDLGVRWYMRGELGEVVPEHDSVVLPDVNKTVVPDLRYRSLRLGNISNYPWHELVWHVRLGLNDNSLAGSHGMRQILYATKQHEEHPEYFALNRNKRMNNPNRGSAHTCYSQPGLKDIVLKYARKRFDNRERLP